MRLNLGGKRSEFLCIKLRRFNRVRFDNRCIRSLHFARIHKRDTVLLFDVDILLNR